MKRSIIFVGLLSLATISCSKSEKGVLGTQPEESTQSFLTRFYQNPAKVMNETPVKTNSRGEVVSTSRFSENEIISRKFIAKRDLVRASIMGLKGLSNRSNIEEDHVNNSGYFVTDRAENLVDRGAVFLNDLVSMEKASLKSAKLPVQPWSDDYWAIKNGVLGYRYADDTVPSGTWKEILEFSEANTVESYVRGGKVDMLSPSEKYDLLVGDTEGTLTKNMFEEGRYYFEKDGSVEAWMGICHGWAPAAYMLPRPSSSLTLKSLDGQTDITFYPSDIKALGSLLWAKGSPSSRFIGGRCNDKDPKKDENGRILDQSCFDTNPGSWHMSVVNQIGLSKRSMVLDATFDYEVWNQPMLSYSYSYFNPETSEAADTLTGALIPMGQFSRDVFKSYRSANAVSVVGIEMTIEYIVETSPGHELFDSPANDAVQSATYRYDLELDQYGRIIGGEWYTNAHPDFLWTPEKNGKARSRFENLARGKWNPRTKPVLPQELAEMGKMAGSEGMPLARIVEALFKASAATPAPVPAPAPEPTPEPVPDTVPVGN